MHENDRSQFLKFLHLDYKFILKTKPFRKKTWDISSRRNMSMAFKLQETVQFYDKYTLRIYRKIETFGRWYLTYDDSRCARYIKIDKTRTASNVICISCEVCIGSVICHCRMYVFRQKNGAKWLEIGPGNVLRNIFFINYKPSFDWNQFVKR